jgi:hypothetical protein
VGRLLGPRRTELPPISFDAQIEELGTEGFELALNVQHTESSAQRRVRLTTCVEIQEAAALLIATAIDPDAALRAVPKPPAEATDEPPAPSAPPRPLARWSLLLGGVGDLQSLPGLTAGPMLGGLLSWTHLRASVQARYLAPRTAKSDDAPDVVSRLDLFAASLGASVVWPLGPLVLGPAAQAEVGFLRARTRGPADTTEAKPWGSALLGAAVGYGASARLGLELAVYAGIPLFRPRVLARSEQDPIEIHQGERFLVRAELALRVSLGPKD